MKTLIFVALLLVLDAALSISDEAILEQMQALTRMYHELKAENRQQETRIEQQETRIEQLEANCGCDGSIKGQDLVQNTTIEERVTILETQMTEALEELTELENEVTFLFEEQVIQDERIFNLEERTFDLDERKEMLEEGGGGGGNVTELEERVETLEGTAAEHEADIADLESSVTNLDGRVETVEGDNAELDTRLTAAETQIEDLQATDVELDSRISDLEEGGGGANETVIAFRAVMDETDDDSILFGSTVIFSDVQVNEGNGYDSDTGVFTVPSGGDGFYYFATHFTVLSSRYVYIDIRVNDVAVCTMYEDNQDVVDNSNDGCNTLVFLSEGDEVKNVYWTGTNTAPVYESDSGIYNGFSGFRI